MLALCVFRDDRGRVLVGEGYDPTKRQTFYRPLGGGIEPGERAVDAARREIREELGRQIDNPRLLGVLENLFTFDGRGGHEVVFVFEADFVDRDCYACDELPGMEGDTAFRAVWKQPAEFDGVTPLYPDDLLKLLEWSDSGGGG